MEVRWRFFFSRCNSTTQSCFVVQSTHAGSNDTWVCGKGVLAKLNGPPEQQVRLLALHFPV